MAFIIPSDLAAFATIDEAKAEAMIEDAEAMAALAAPCITDPAFLEDATLVSGVKAVLRQAIIRWDETGSGAVTQVGAGPYQQSVDTRQNRRGMFWPSEITQLRDLCNRFSNTSTSGRAFEVDTMPSDAGGVYGVDYVWASTTDRLWL